MKINKIKKRLLSITLISLMILSLFSPQITNSTYAESDGEKQLQEEIDQAVKDSNSTEEEMPSDENTSNEISSSSSLLSSSSRSIPTTRTNEEAMYTSMKNFATTNNNENGTYSTEQTETLPNSWKNYVNTIWQYKAMGSYDSDGTGTTVGDADAFKWTDTATLTTNGGNDDNGSSKPNVLIPQWSGRMAGRDANGQTAVTHPWLNGDKSTKTTESDGKVRNDDITQVISNGQITDIKANFKNNTTETDPAKDNPLMVPFSTYTKETAINDDTTGGPEETTVGVRTFYVWSPEQFLYALRFQNTSDNMYQDNSAMVTFQLDNASTHVLENTNSTPGDYASTSSYTQLSSINKIKIVFMRDIDLAGHSQNWPNITFYFINNPSINHYRIELDGNNKTIYNLGRFNEKGHASRAVGLFIGFAGLDVKNLTFKSAMVVAQKGTGASSVGVGIFGRAETTSTPNYSKFGASELTNVHINNSMFYTDTESSYISPFGGFSLNDNANTAPAIINQCSTDQCYVYGGDHVAGFTISNTGGKKTSKSDINWKNASITNSYSSNILLATYGGHSGGFLSCHAKNVDVKNCFSDIDMYVASNSGGFVGLFAGTIENCFSTGKLEGYTNCGGFAAAVPNTGAGGVNTGATITSCYSTVLTGMRQESQYMGGFYSASKSVVSPSSRVSSYTIKSCYAAGEVSDIGVDVTSTATASTARYSGGFVSSLHNGNGSNGYIGDSGSNVDKIEDCYYDKQTTAMKEFAAGNYNKKVGTSNNEIGVTSDTEEAYKETTKKIVAGIHGVLTSNTTVGTNSYGGLVGANPTANANGFKGFSNGDWQYTSTNYPQLESFVNPITFSDAQKDIVKKYSNISTSTLLLETWDKGYKWNNNGIRSVEELEYNGDPYTEGGSAAIEGHTGDIYTYDTVRDLVRDVKYNPSSVNIKRLLDVSGGNVLDIDKTVSDGTIKKTNAFNIFDTGTMVNQSAGMGWFDINDGVDPDNKIERPIRLISTISVFAGENKTVFAGELYNHRDDVRLTTSVDVTPNLIIGLDNDKTWSTVITGGYASKNNEYEAPGITRSDEYFAARTYNMEYDENSEPVDSSNIIMNAWIYTEIWRVKQLYPADLETYAANNGVTNNGDKAVYVSASGDEEYNDKETNQYWCIEKEDDELAVYLRKKSGTIENLDIDLYVEDVRIALDGTIADDAIDKIKWNGELPLYPDTSTPKKYTLTYYWLLNDGRYATNYKTIAMLPGHYNIYMNSYSDTSGNSIDSSYYDPSQTGITDPLNPYALIMQTTKDTLNTKNENGVLVGNYAKSYNRGLNGLYTTETSILGPEEAKADIQALDNIASDSTFDTFHTSKADSVGYTHDSTVAWKALNSNIKINKLRLTMYSRSGTVMGYAIIDTSEWSQEDFEGKKIKVENVKYYGTKQVSSVDGGIEEVTVLSKANVTYKINKDTDGVYYISFDKMLNAPVTGSLEETTTQPDSAVGIEVTVPDENDKTEEEYSPYINDTMYNIRLDFWVETVDLTLQKQIVGTYSNPNAKFNFDATVKNLMIDPAQTTIDYFDSANGSDVKGQLVLDGTTDTTDDSRLKDAKNSSDIQLGQLDKIVFKNIPTGIEYEFVEKSMVDDTVSEFATYTKKALYSNGSTSANDFREIPTMSSSPPINYTDSTLTVNGTTHKDVSFVRYQNAKDYVVPTGFDDNLLPYLIIIAIVIVVGISYYRYRKKKTGNTTTSEFISSKKVKKVTYLSLMIMVMMMLLYGFASPISALTGNKLNIPVHLDVTYQEATNEKFTFILEPITPGAPMPNNTTTSDVLEMDGSGTGYFDTIEYSEIGEYRYRVHQQAGSTKGASYDDSVYDIIVLFLNGDPVEVKEIHVLASKEGDSSKSDISFVNTFKEVVNPPKPIPTPDVTVNPTPIDNIITTIVKTGDENAMFIPLIVLAFVSLSVVVIIRKKKLDR